MIAFKGRPRGRVYQPKKPHKWGLQAYMLAESNSGYCYNVEIYAGQRSDDDVDREIGGVTYATVMRLARPCFGRGHHLYFDNYYTSSQVLGDLLLNHFGACGTLHVSRKGVPSLIRHAKLRPSQALVSKRRHGIQYLRWKDKRQVNLANTIHNANTFQQWQRARNPEHQRVVEKPVAIELYTRLWVESTELIRCCGHSYSVTRP